MASGIPMLLTIDHRGQAREMGGGVDRIAEIAIVARNARGRVRARHDMTGSRIEQAPSAAEMARLRRRHSDDFLSGAFR